MVTCRVAAAAIAFVAFVASCGRPDASLTAKKKKEDEAAKAAAVAYLKADYSERYKCVHGGESLKKNMEKFYSGHPEGEVKSVTVESVKTIRKAGTAAEVSATMEGMLAGRKFKGRVSCIVTKRKGDSWLVDWPATVGYNRPTIAAIRATAPEKEQVVRAVAEISDIYLLPYSRARGAYWSVKLSDADDRSLHAYVDRTSKLGKRIHELLKDGDKQKLTLSIQCQGDDGSAAEITKIVSEDWLVDD